MRPNAETIIRRADQFFIEVLNLPKDLASRLKPSVRDEYARLWNATHEAANKGPGLE